MTVRSATATDLPLLLMCPEEVSILTDLESLISVVKGNLKETDLFAKLWLHSDPKWDLNFMDISSFSAADSSSARQWARSQSCLLT